MDFTVVNWGSGSEYSIASRLLSTANGHAIILTEAQLENRQFCCYLYLNLEKFPPKDTAKKYAPEAIYKETLPRIVKQNLQHLWKRENLRIVTQHGEQMIVAFQPRNDKWLEERKRTLALFLKDCY